jgi:hypothetical protein
MEAFQMAKLHYKLIRNLPDSDYHNDQIQVAIDFYLNNPVSLSSTKVELTTNAAIFGWKTGVSMAWVIDSEVIIVTYLK